MARIPKTPAAKMPRSKYKPTGTVTQPPDKAA